LVSAVILTTVPDVLLVVGVMFAAGTVTIAALTPVTLHELAKDHLRANSRRRAGGGARTRMRDGAATAAGRSTADNAGRDHSVPSHCLTSWFTAWIQRLYDIDSAA
jgi:hypothetical protein